MLEKKFDPLRVEKQPIIVLVEPQLPENIGMVARAMQNFGLYRLRLVNPREKFPCEKAYRTASKATDVIEDAVQFETLEEAILDLHYVCATTARKRYNFKFTKSPTEGTEILKKRIENNQKVGILFGRERAGLTNEEIDLADEMVTFPVNQAFSSLNLAQAVLLMAYEWRKQTFNDQNQLTEEGFLNNSASKKELYGLFHHLENALKLRGYFRPETRQKTMVSNLRSVLTRAEFCREEIQLLHGVVSSLEKFNPEFPKGTQSVSKRFSLENTLKMCWANKDELDE